MTEKTERRAQADLKALAEIAAKKVPIAGWKGYGFRSISGGIIVMGCVPDGVYARGENKGKPRFRKPIPGTKREVVVSDDDVNRHAELYEADTGNCFNCKGAGQEWAGWSRDAGTRYRTCRRCEGTGKAISFERA